MPTLSIADAIMMRHPGGHTVQLPIRPRQRAIYRPATNHKDFYKFIHQLYNIVVTAEQRQNGKAVLRRVCSSNVMTSRAVTSMAEACAIYGSNIVKHDRFWPIFEAVHKRISPERAFGIRRAQESIKILPSQFPTFKRKVQELLKAGLHPTGPYYVFKAATVRAGTTYIQSKSFWTHFPKQEEWKALAAEANSYIDFST